MKNKTVVFGAGYLGNRISQTLGYSITDTRVRGDLSELRSFLDQEKPSTVVCTMGRTGRPNIDWCETHEVETYEGNVIEPLKLAKECASRGIYFVNIGSGCIFNGYNNGRGFDEEDKSNYKGFQVYADSKILFEELLARMPADFKRLQLRIRMPIDDRPHERNLIDKLKCYSKVINVPNSMTTVPHLITALDQLISANKTGTYNITNPGTISAAEIMKLYNFTIDSSHKFEVFSLDDLDKVTVGKRSNCKLNTSKLEKEGINLPQINEAVTACLWAYKRELDLKKESF